MRGMSRVNEEKSKSQLTMLSISILNVIFISEGDLDLEADFDLEWDRLDIFQSAQKIMAPASNPHARKEESSKIADDNSTILFDKCERITILLAHSFYFKKNNLKPEEQRAIDQFHLSSPKRLLLDYCKKGNYIAVKLMCGRWRRALFVRKVIDSYVKVFYLDYGYADEDVMEDQIYVLPEESIKYPPIQAQKLVIEGT